MPDHESCRCPARGRHYHGGNILGLGREDRAQGLLRLPIQQCGIALDHSRGLVVREPFDFERMARERRRSERVRKPPIRKLRRLPAENGCSSSTLSISSHVSRLWPFFFMTKVLTVAQGIQALPGRLANPRMQCWKISPVMKKWSVKLETCRSSRAWLNSGAVLAINHQLFVCHSALASFWVVK